MDENIIMMIVWVSLFIFALLAEIFTDALVSVWFCIGAVLALSVTFIPNMPWWGELIVFLGTSLLSFIIIRPIVNRKLQRIKSRTNIDTILGKKGIVLKKITSLEKGEVKVDSIIWNAIKREDEEDILEGSVVEVLAVNGNKLLVKEINEGGN